MNKIYNTIVLNKHLYLTMWDIWRKTKSMKYFFVWQQKCYWKWLWLGWLGLELFFIMKCKFFNQR